MTARGHLCPKFLLELELGGTPMTARGPDLTAGQGRMPDLQMIIILALPASGLRVFYKLCYIRLILGHLLPE